MTKISKFLFSFILCVSIASSPAYASKTVTLPVVNEGKFNLESRTGYDFDDNDNKNGAVKEKIILGYGVTEYWQAEIDQTFDRSGDDKSERKPTSIEWRNKFQITDQTASFADTGIRLGYIRDETGDNADKLEARFLAGKSFGDFAHLVNVTFTKEVGDNAETGVAWNTAVGSRYRYSDEFQPGIELYDTFGKIGDPGRFNQQTHQIGPVFYGKFKNGLSYDAGYLFGISGGAPDGTAKVILKYIW